MNLPRTPLRSPISGIGGITSALGYAIINVQIPGVPSYNEEQVALVIQDVSGLGAKVPVILGMPTIYRLCRQMKENRDRLCAEGVANTPYSVMKRRRAYFYNPWEVGPDGTGFPTNTGQDPMDLDEQLILTDKVTIPAFASQIIKVRTKKDVYERPSPECHDTTTIPRR